MSVAALEASSTGTWQQRLNAFHLHGVKRDYYGGRYDPDILGSVRTILAGGDSLVYPAKTFLIAWCYAQYIAEHFNEEVRSVLAYEHLLYDDEHFTPYNDETQGLYEAIGVMMDHAGFKHSELYMTILGYCREELCEPR